MDLLNFNKDYANSSRKDKVNYFLLICGFPLLIFILSSIIMHSLEVLALGICFVLFFLGIYCNDVFYNKIYPFLGVEISDFSFKKYRSCVVSLLVSPSLFLFGLWIGFIFSNLIMGLVISFSLTLPIFLTLLRKNTFNKYFYMENDKFYIGFDPIFYQFTSICIGLYGYVNGFRSSGWDALIWIIIVFAFQLILLFPDKVNRVFPLEVRTKKGCFAFLGSVIILFLIFIFTCQNILLGTGVQIGNLSIKNLFYWIIGGILAIIFLKKSKDMWE
ncbi:hypothetical protein [Methanobrevibacter woesei]|uniref:hypothetical protein n=1 Tax=Methanobrevibacter woesei TaxID=190976 RepID=UPI0023F36D2A|nr:hypothetical protein [Methanobrevibacter woesei]